ncbi:MAG: LPS export ABC transporter permease LptF [Arsenophonus sp.]
MIIIQYLIRETLKSQVTIFFILILIFFSKKTINILSLAVQGNIPSDLVFHLLWLGIPEMMQLILPLSLFLGLLITYSKLYINSEIIVMHACGLGKRILIMAASILALFIALMQAVNVVWILPLSTKYQEHTLAYAKANPILTNMIEGQFKTIEDQNIVLYIADVKGKNFTDVFMAQLFLDNKQRHSVIIAENGYIKHDRKGNQILVLNNGTRYEGTALFGNFRITDVKDYKVVINHKEPILIGDKIKQKNMLQLWLATDIKSNEEFHWRLTLIISVFIMALIAVPLSEVNPRHGRLLIILPAILIYIIFFLLQSTFHSNTGKYEIDNRIIIWLINSIFFLLGVILNIWDIVLMRRLREKFYKRVK